MEREIAGNPGAIGDEVKTIGEKVVSKLEQVLASRGDSAIAKVTPENFKGKGLKFLVPAEEKATMARKFVPEATVEETLNKYKDIGLDVVELPSGEWVYGVKNPWTGWENLPNWKPEYADKSFAELKKIYGNQISSDMYFKPAGTGMFKAYEGVAEDGAARVDNGIRNVAFQANETAGELGAKALISVTHVDKDGMPIDFAKMSDGWTGVRKGKFNASDPAHPLPVEQTAVAWAEERPIMTLEGLIKSNCTMTDGGGFPYNKFKDLWKQATRGKIIIQPGDEPSRLFFEEAHKFNKLAAKSKDGLSEAAIKNIENEMQACQDRALQLIKEATR